MYTLWNVELLWNKQFHLGFDVVQTTLRDSNYLIQTTFCYSGDQARINFHFLRVFFAVVSSFQTILNIFNVEVKKWWRVPQPRQHLPIPQQILRRTPLLCIRTTGSVMMSILQVIMPQFQLSDDPETWFNCAEQIFQTHKINTELEKFGYLLQSLAHKDRTRMQIKDIVNDTVNTVNNKYLRAKTRLVCLHRQSEDNKIWSL